MHTDRQSWIHAMHQLADRNGVVELTPLTKRGERLSELTVRSRILAADDEGAVVTEAPAIEPQRWTQVRAVQILAVNHTHRLTAASRLEKWRPFSLNARTSVEAVQLGAPLAVRSAQRRQHFRVNTVAVPVSAVRIQAIDPAGAAADQAVSSQMLHARMMNLSGGGMGVLIDPDDPNAKLLLKGRDYQCSFTLPDDPATIMVQAHLVHYLKRRDKRIYLGMSFQFLGQTPCEADRTQDRIIRFTTELQRLQLQRQRGAI